MLEVLASVAEAIVTRNTLSEMALRRPWRADDRSVDQLIFTLGQKLSPDEDGGMLIHHVRGLRCWLRAFEDTVLPRVQDALAVSITALHWQGRLDAQVIHQLDAAHRRRATAQPLSVRNTRIALP